MRTKQTIKPWITRIQLMGLIVALSLYVGCDSDVGTTPEADVTFEGRVTDDAGFGNDAVNLARQTAATAARSAKQSEIEGAVVTAANLEANGSLTELDGQATTDVEGRFALDVDGAADLVVLTAEKGDFRSQVLVFRGSDDSGTVRTIPMTSESEAEAAVYVETVAEGIAGDEMTIADVAAYVNQELAVEWESGATTTAEIVAALKAAARAEAEYFGEDEEAEVDADALRRGKRRSFLTLQADLNAAVTTSAQAAAISALERALVAAYTDAGVSLEAQAKARQANRAALVRFSNASSSQARFALRQQAEILTSLATAHAIEAAFEAEGASQARLNSLAEARGSLLAGLRATSSDEEIVEVRAEYDSQVEGEVMAEINIDAILLGLVETVLATAKATLDSSVDAAASAGAVASAYATYFAAAETSAAATLAGSGNAGLGAEVLTLLST